MSKTDAIQQAVNRASLMQTLPEEVARAMRKAEVHPDLAKVIMSMHHTQAQLDKDLRELRNSMLDIAKVMVSAADSTAQVMEMIADLNAQQSSPVSAEGV